MELTCINSLLVFIAVCLFFVILPAILEGIVYLFVFIALILGTALLLLHEFKNFIINKLKQLNSKLKKE